MVFYKKLIYKDNLDNSTAILTTLESVGSF